MYFLNSGSMSFNKGESACENMLHVTFFTPESSLADAQDGCVTGSAGVSHNVSDDARQLGHIVELWGFASTVKTR